MLKEYKKKTSPGLPMLGLFLSGMGISVFGLVFAAKAQFVPLIVLCPVVGLVSLFLLFGLFTVQPNESKVLTFFGRYAGTVETSGLQWANPFFLKSTVSKRVRNFETEKLKVNDKSGSPIEIAAVVVWKVVDTAEAMFEVEDFTNFVHVQSEAALRNLATRYAYDSHEPDTRSLRANTEEIASMLQGVEVGEWQHEVRQGVRRMVVRREQGAVGSVSQQTVPLLFYHAYKRGYRPIREHRSTTHQLVRLRCVGMLAI